MNRSELDNFLRYLDRMGHWIFTTQMAGVYFHESDNTLRHSMARHVRNNVITRLSKGVYANFHARSRPSGYLLEDMIKHLRPDCFSYIVRPEKAYFQTLQEDTDYGRSLLVKIAKRRSEQINE